MSGGHARTLCVWVPTNRRGRDGLPTHMDGWNEIVAAYKRSRHAGSKRELANVEHVASYVLEAMQMQRWPRMSSKLRAMPCRVALLFVERDRRRDIGNVHGGAKYALDALTWRHPRGAGAIHDDSQKWLEDVAYAVTVDPKNPGLLIKVRMCEARA